MCREVTYGKYVVRVRKKKYSKQLSLGLHCRNFVYVNSVSFEGFCKKCLRELIQGLTLRGEFNTTTRTRHK